MFYYFLASEYGHPTWEENFNESHTIKPNQNIFKQWDVPKSAANIYQSKKSDFFPVILLFTNHQTLYNLNIMLSCHPPFEPITAYFTIVGLWSKLSGIRIFVS